MDRVSPPGSPDWVDAVTGFLVVVGGSFLTLFAVEFLTL